MAIEFKKVFVFIGALGVLLGLWALLARNSKDFKESAGIVQFQMHNSTNEIRDIKEFRGKWVLLNFWAEWCEACKEEFQSLKVLEKELAKENFVLLCVSIDPLSSDSPFFEVAKFPKNVFYLDRLEVLNQMGIESLPTSFLVNPRGQIVETFWGYQQWSQAPMLDRIRRTVRN